MSCVTLFHVLSPNMDNCQVLDMAMAVRTTQELPMEGLHRYMQLPQLRLQTSHVFDSFFIQTRSDGIRSASAGSYIGIEGETMVWAIHRAQAGYRRGSWTVFGGMIDDLWVLRQNDLWGNRNQAFGMAERNGWLSRSDIGMAAQYRNERAYAQVRVSAGEGSNFEERNNGITTQILGAVQLGAHEVSVFGQEGSQGVSSSPSHRVGMRISSSDAFGYGLEVMKSWGVKGDSTLNPLGVSVWLTRRPTAGLWGFVRGDLVAYEEPAQANGWLGLGWGLAPFAHIVVATGQQYSWDMGYQSTGTHQWQQSYYIQLQLEQQFSLQQ